MSMDEREQTFEKWAVAKYGEFGYIAIALLAVSVVVGAVCLAAVVFIALWWPLLFIVPITILLSILRKYQKETKPK